MPRGEVKGIPEHSAAILEPRIEEWLLVWPSAPALRQKVRCLRGQHRDHIVTVAHQQPIDILLPDPFCGEKELMKIVPSRKKVLAISLLQPARIVRIDAEWTRKPAIHTAERP